jgi:mannose-1-phosphate guanylyltransferase
LPSKFDLERNGSNRQSFFSAAIERALAVTNTSADSNIIIMAGKNHFKCLTLEFSKLNIDKRKRFVLIPEPTESSTAQSIACALVYNYWISAGRERNILVISNDHIINPLNAFISDARIALSLAQKDKLVVFVYRPKKTDLKTAKTFPAEKKYFCNSGMYAFSSKFMLSEFMSITPEIITPFRKLWAPSESMRTSSGGLEVLENWDNLETAYKSTKPESFENAIAKKCESTIMLKADFFWTEINNWDEYLKLTKKSNAEVYGTGDNCRSCFVDSDIPVALCGVEDLVVVVRSGKDGGTPAVFVSKKDETSRLRAISEKIKKSGLL